MPEGLLKRISALFETDDAVERVANDPALTAELLLLFRMMLADGQISAAEMDTFKRICRDSFGIDEAQLDAVIHYLQDFGYETTGTQAVEVFRSFDHARRVELARHMAEIAKADAALNPHEVRILKRVLDVLDLTAEEIVGEG